MTKKAKTIKPKPVQAKHKKTSSRRSGLFDITNRQRSPSVQNEPTAKPKSVTITLLASKSMRMKNFQCYADHRVYRGLPLSGYRIEQAIDNDCDTDEQQVSSAIDMMSRHLRNAINGMDLQD